MQPFVPSQLVGTPFTTTQARAAGLSPSALRSAPWVHVFRDVWVHRSVADTRELRLAAARLILPERAVLCGETAAWLHGVDVRRQADLDVHASFPEGGRIRPRIGLKVCQETLDADDVELLDGVLTTSPLRTAFDCIRWLRDVDGIVVVDALAHAGLITIDEVRDYCEGKHRLRNLRIGERRLDDADPGAESPMETRSRLAFIRGGLPRPETQIEVHDPSTGRLLARLDMGWRELKAAAEFDGRHHQFRQHADDLRRAAAAAVGWKICVFTADDLYTRSSEMVAEMAAALRSRRTGRWEATAG